MNQLAILSLLIFADNLCGRHTRVRGNPCISTVRHPIRNTLHEQGACAGEGGGANTHKRAHLAREYRTMIGLIAWSPVDKPRCSILEEPLSLRRQHNIGGTNSLEVVDLFRVFCQRSEILWREPRKVSFLRLVAISKASALSASVSALC